MPAFHEVEAMLYSLHLRRARYHVHYLGHYLGRNFAAEEETLTELVQEARRHQPAMILFIASTAAAAERLGQLSSHLIEAKRLPAIIGYCGLIYSHEPEVRATTTGVYLGASAKEVVQNIDGLFSARLFSDKNRHAGSNGKQVNSKVDQKQDKKHDQKVHNGTTLLPKPW
jgi:hypothetical protein